MASTEPKKIQFESATCGRCAGKGRRTDGGWAAHNKGLCLACDGVGSLFTSNGLRAKAALRKATEAKLGATWGELEIGTAYWFEGRCYRKGTYDVATPSSKVLRHNGPVTRQLWKEIAAKYTGATLVY